MQSEQTYESPNTTIRRDSYMGVWTLRRAGSPSSALYLARHEITELAALLAEAMRDDQNYTKETQ